MKKVRFALGGLFTLLIVFLTSVSLYGQTNSPGASSSGSSMTYLERTFPKLTELYRQELNNCRTHYIFAVDVSGSMVKYDELVTPALKAFAMALPVGEEVSIIPFGTDAKLNTPGLCCEIADNSQKQVLATALSTLYKNDGYTSEFKRNTDVAKAVAAINKTILNNQERQMNVVVIITDFINDLPGEGEEKIEDDVLQELNKNFDNVTGDSYTRVVALQLPPMGSEKGFCLNQLQEEVFCNTTSTKRFDVVQVINDQNAISHWFEQLTRDIMTDKLRAVIQLDNMRSLRPSLKTNIDIDGKTTAEIHWTPNKLYNKIKIDSTYTGKGSDFIFENNKKAWQTTRDTVIKDLELGQLKHKSWGFRQYDEELNLGLSLPTEYDDELTKLSIDKPIPDTSCQRKGWLFTFFMPFWLTLTLLVLLILYIIGVIKAILRNSKLCFKGNLTFFDDLGNQLDGVVRLPKQSPSAKLTVGKGGSPKCSVDNADWQFVIEKKKANPLLVFAKPYFLWHATIKYVANGSAQSGKLSYNGPTSVRVKCGSSRGDITHSVKIQLTK